MMPVCTKLVFQPTGHPVDVRWDYLLGMPCCSGNAGNSSKEQGDIVMHVKRIVSLASLALLGALSLPPSGLATEAAKEGTARYTTYWVASSYSPIKLGSDGFAIFDFSGVTSSDNPMFNHLAFHCLGSSTMSQATHLNHGACSALAPDGSQLFLTFELNQGDKISNGKNVFVSGTGSFKGISGGGTYTDKFLQGPDGKAMFVSDHEVKWKLP
jgi:hypothetical protein